jgi:hypothetical protein
MPVVPVSSPNAFVIEEQLLLAASSYIDACEYCCSDLSLTRFIYILDELTGQDPTNTQYLLSRPVRCPQCNQPISEKTFVFTATR